MGKKIPEFGSATVIILLNLMLASIVYSQSETDSVAISIINVSDANIDSTINQYPVLVLYCYKSGCDSCERMAVALDEIAQDLRDKVTFAKIDTKENLEFKDKYKINDYPTLLLFDNGTLINRISGFASKEFTKNKIASSFSLSNPTV